MPTWPTSLPQNLIRRGYREGLPDNVIRTSVDAGPEKRRRRFTAAVRPLSGKIAMSSTEIETLRAFFREDIGDGALAFDFPNPFDATETLSVVFARPPSWTNAGGDVYDVTLELEIQP